MTWLTWLGIFLALFLLALFVAGVISTFGGGSDE